jgi:hypothetical protein
VQLDLSAAPSSSRLEVQTPLGRIAQPDDIGPLAVFLASTDGFRLVDRRSSSGIWRPSAKAQRPFETPPGRVPSRLCVRRRNQRFRRMFSWAPSPMANQALMVLLAYTLVQAHLVLCQRQLNYGIGERRCTIGNGSVCSRSQNSAESSSTLPSPFGASCGRNSDASSAHNILCFKPRSP